jgi:hypothetical protein
MAGVFKYEVRNVQAPDSDANRGREASSLPEVPQEADGLSEPDLPLCKYTYRRKHRGCRRPPLNLEQAKLVIELHQTTTLKYKEIAEKVGGSKDQVFAVIEQWRNGALDFG